MMDRPPSPVAELLASYEPRTPLESADVRRIASLVSRADDPWNRANPLHLTASALVVHVQTGQVLLRWHERQQTWLHIGGHGDPGEDEPLAIALREGAEETGLSDLRPWPNSELLHAVVVPVPAHGADPAHEHADLRIVLATDRPDDARPERPAAGLRWMALPEALRVCGEANLRESLNRLERVLERNR
jgi:8-oxo-dGTP pyrophosphatase MutT (NUDIX family)